VPDGGKKKTPGLGLRQIHTSFYRLGMGCGLVLIYPSQEHTSPGGQLRKLLAR